MQHDRAEETPPEGGPDIARERRALAMVREIMEDGSASTPEARAARLAAIDDDRLRAMVARYLGLDGSGGDGFDEARLGSAAAVHLQGLVADALDAEASGPAIAGFRILRRIGEGGMGVVYEAEQERPRRRVALKVMRHALSGRSLRARFDHEAELLGQLRHPGIAGILSTGTFEAVVGGQRIDQPYICMELVDGRPLIEHAAARRLGPRDRVELLADACDAVQHAHGRGIIHRDLKPSNILVEEDPARPDSPGRVRVLDFGVSRLVGDLGAGAGDAGRPATLTGEIVGTPAYMSPEQFLLRPGELDIRCDVYSLGVTLYELLTGAAPHDLTDVPVAQIPARISGVAPRTLWSFDPALRGDLERVVAKAMAPDRERRYPTASELAADLRRVLAGEPVLARPPSRWDRVARWARRHPRLAGTALGATATLLLAGAGATAMAIETARARDAARDEARVTAAVNDFVDQDLLGAAAPSVALGREITVREVLDAASKRIDGRFPDSPRSEAGVRVTLGRTYVGLGLPDEARRHLERAVELRRTSDGPDAEPTLMAEVELAKAIELGGDLQEAARRAESTYRRASGRYGEDAEVTDVARNDLGATYIKAMRYEEAEALLAPVLRRRLRLRGRDDVETLVAMNNLAGAQEGLDDVDSAGAVFEDLVRRGTGLLGAEHPHVLTWRNNLGWNLLQRDCVEEAAEVLGEGLDAAVRVWGADHEATLRYRGNLAQATRRLGRLDEAGEQLLAIFQASERIYGHDAAETVRHLTNYVGYLRQVRPPAEAVPYLEDLIDRGSRAHPPGHPLQAFFLSRYGGTLLRAGRPADALAALRRAWSIIEGPIVRDGDHDEFGLARDLPTMLMYAACGSGDLEEARRWSP